LQRPLQRDGRNFSDILDAVRRDLAIKYLSYYEQPLTDLAGLLGFSELSVFSRWFAHRFGCTATNWRQQSQQSSSGKALSH
jgi:AraC-like DNA-binding protein